MLFADFLIDILTKLVQSLQFNLGRGLMSFSAVFSIKDGKLFHISQNHLTSLMEIYFIPVQQ